MEDTILRTVLMKNFIDFRPRILDSLSGYNIKLFGQDSMAGIIVALVAALPLALAFAIASGASPEVGLISAIVGGFISAVLSGCRVQIGGPTGSFIVIAYALLQINYYRAGRIYKLYLSFLSPLIDLWRFAMSTEKHTLA